MNGFNKIYFDSSGVEHISIRNLKTHRKKIIIRNIYSIQAFDSIMCGYFCIAFIDFMLKAKILC